MKSIRAVVFDRDGTLIRHIPYLSRAEDVVLLDGVAEGLRTLRESRIPLFIHTNQSGVGRGWFDLEAVETCNRRMMELIGLGDSLFEDICIAPERPDQPARYRKPSPRFVEEIAQGLAVSASSVCYVGDRASDLLTAKNAGAQAVGLRTGGDDIDEELKQTGLMGIFPVCDTFKEMLDLLVPRLDGRRKPHPLSHSRRHHLQRR